MQSIILHRTSKRYSQKYTVYNNDLAEVVPNKFVS